MTCEVLQCSVLQRLATPEDYGDNQAARHWRQDKEEAEQIGMS